MPNKQKMTLDKLAALVKTNSTDINKLASLVEVNSIDIDKLAALVQNGFVEFEEKIDKKLEEKISEVKLELNEFKEEMTDFKKETSKNMENILGKLEDLETENISGLEQYKRQDKTLTNHETRIAKLEKSLH